MEVQLRKWRQEDKERLIKICNGTDRSYLADRLPSPYTEKDAVWWLGMVGEQDGKTGIFRAIVADGVYVGNISVEQKSDVYRRDGEIGYLLLTDYWSRGIATEAVRQICLTAFEELDIIRITGNVYEPNEASKKVLKKNGFIHEGTLKNAVTKDGKTYNLCIFGKCIREQDGSCGNNV